MQYTSWLRWSVIGLLCLSLFTLFIIADGARFPLNMFFPYITGKNFAFRILIEVALGAYVLLAIREPKYRPRSSLLMWAFGLFVLWMAIATVVSVDPLKSFWSNFERMDGYITQLHMFAFFIMAGVILTAEEWWKKFFQLSTIASVIMAIYSLMQVFHLFGIAPSSQSGARADGTFGNAIYLAVYMLFALFITLYLLWQERKNSTMVTIYGIVLVLQAATLWYTQTRGALLGFVGGLIIAAIYIAIFARGAQWRTMRRYSIGAVGVIAVLAVLFLVLRNVPSIKNNPGTIGRIASISLSDKTTVARFIIWGEAWQGFKESPKTALLGWGQENFNFVFNKYYNPEMYDQEQWFDRAHNAFIDWALAGGLPAFLLYVSLFVLGAWAFYRSELEVPEQALFVGLLAGYAFNNLTVFDNLGSYIYFYLILAFAHALSRTQLSRWMFMSKPLGDRTVAVAAPIVLVVLVWGVWEFNGPGLARAQTLIDALTPVTSAGTAKDPSQNLASFKSALAIGTPLGYQENVEQLYQYATTIGASSAVSPEIKQQVAQTTQSAAVALMAQRKHDARLELFDGVFLDQYNQFQAAMQQLQAALADSPRKQQILFEIGDTYLAAGDTKDALPPLQQAYEEEPNYQDAALQYAVGLYYNNQVAQGDALLQKTYGTVLVDNPTLLQTYFTNKMYARLAGIYEMRLKANPNDAQALIGDAVTTFLVNGNKAAAIAELQKAAKADPNYASVAQAFEQQVQAGKINM